jgi:hypothetical protein
MAPKAQTWIHDNIKMDLKEVVFVIWTEGAQFNNISWCLIMLFCTLYSEAVKTAIQK